MIDKLEIGTSLTRAKIKELVFRELEGRGFKIINPSVGNGYYLFDFGDESVVHFKIKGIRNWMFALWIREDGEEYTVDFFGDKINWIDKFKPSRSTVAAEQLRLPKELTEENFDNYRDPGDVVYDVIEILCRLKANRHIAEYGLDETGEGFIKWLWGEIKWYDIQKPLEKFYEGKVIPILYKLTLGWIGLRYHKYVKPRAIVDQNKIFEGCSVSPRWLTGVEYKEGLTEDEIFQTWCAIQDSKCADFLRKYSHFAQYKDAEDRRGFYYNKKEAEED